MYCHRCREPFNHEDCATITAERIHSDGTTGRFDFDFCVKLLEKGYDSYDREQIQLVLLCALDTIVPCKKCPTVDKRKGKWS